MPIRQDTLRERWLAANRYSATTERTYRATLWEFQRRFPCHADKVMAAHLVDFLTTDPDGHETRRAPSTLKRQRAVFNTFWRWCHRQGYVSANPAVDLDLMELGHGQRRAGRWLTQEDAVRLLDACCDGTEQGDRDHALIATAML